MSQKTYMYDTQWQALINAIDGGDTSAIATALGQIKTSIDSIETALGSLSTDVTQDSTQWTNLINAISSGGGGGGGNVTIDSTQWSNLLTEIGKGDMAATATALNNIYTRLNSIGFNSTQWNNLVNAITNQSLTVNLSNITSSVVGNLSNVPGATVTDALNSLTANYQDLTLGYFSGYIIRLGKLRIISLYNGSGDQAPIERTLNVIDKPIANVKIGAWVLVGSNTYGSRFLYLNTTGKLYTDSVISRGGFILVYVAQ